MSLPIVDRRFTLDLAGPDDNDEICQLFEDVHVSGDLDLNQERSPDFFALQRLHDGPAMTFLARDTDGRAAAIGSVVMRQAWLDGERIPVGYLCDLRIRPGFRGGVSLARHFSAVLAEVSRQQGVELFTTVVFDDNQVAHKALLGPAATRRQQPRYQPCCPFEMVSLQTTTRRRPDPRVRAATAADLPALRAVLDRRGRQRLLGEDFSGDLLDRRLASWPGFSIDDFLLFEAGGSIRGCLAPWNSDPVKRTRVLGYHGSMLWVKRSFNLGAALLRYPPLPQPGGCLSFAFLTHLEVDDDDPDVLAALLRTAYARVHDQRLHFIAALLPRGSRLAPAFRGFMLHRTAMTLYVVTPPDHALASRDWRTRQPGFEMALS